MKSIFAKAFAEAALLLTSHTLAAKTFAAFWSRVSPKLAEGVGYFEKHAWRPTRRSWSASRSATRKSPALWMRA